jgi:hypothetical protein
MTYTTEKEGGEIWDTEKSTLEKDVKHDNE